MALKKDTWEMIRPSKLDDKKMFFIRRVYNLIFEPAQVESNKASGALEMGQGIKESTFEKLFLRSILKCQEILVKASCQF